jgi:rubrerythrin
MKLLQSHVRHTSHHRLKRTPTGREEEDELLLKELRCFLCQDGGIFEDKLQYSSHFRIVHAQMQSDKMVLPCRDCDATFPMQTHSACLSLLNHMVQKHQFQVPWFVEHFKCEEQDCNFLAFSVSAMRKHTKSRRHSQSPAIFQSYLNFREYRCFLCPNADVLFESKKAFEHHLNVHHVYGIDGDEPSLVCPLCQHVYKLHLSNGVDRAKAPSPKKYDPSRSLCVLLNHMICKHSFAIPPYVVSFKCDHPGCSFTTVKKYTLDRHAKSHVIDKQCYHCGLFFSETRIDKHVQKCNSLSESLKTSMDTAFTCYECGVSFPRKAALTKHLLDTHGVETFATSKNASSSAFQCGLCGKVLLERRSIVKHMQSSHPEAPDSFIKVPVNPAESDDNPKHFECTLCGVQFTLMKSAKQHLLRMHDMRYEAHLIKELLLPVFDSDQIPDFSSALDVNLMSAVSGDMSRLAFSAASTDHISDVLDCSMRLSGLVHGDALPQNFVNDVLMKANPLPSPLIQSPFVPVSCIGQEEDIRPDNPWMQFNKN